MNFARDSDGEAAFASFVRLLCSCSYSLLLVWLGCSSDSGRGGSFSNSQEGWVSGGVPMTRGKHGAYSASCFISALASQLLRCPLNVRDFGLPPVYACTPRLRCSEQAP
jgi:hypothetical protein